MVVARATASATAAAAAAGFGYGGSSRRGNPKIRENSFFTYW